MGLENEGAGCGTEKSKLARLVTIPPGGLGTQKPNRRCAMRLMSPSHTVGSEQELETIAKLEFDGSPSHTVDLERKTKEVKL